MENTLARGGRSPRVQRGVSKSGLRRYRHPRDSPFGMWSFAFAECRDSRTQSSVFLGTRGSPRHCFIGWCSCLLCSLLVFSCLARFSCLLQLDSQFSYPVGTASAIFFFFPDVSVVDGVAAPSVRCFGVCILCGSVVYPIRQTRTPTTAKAEMPYRKWVSFMEYPLISAVYTQYTRRQ